MRDLELVPRRSVEAAHWNAAVAEMDSAWLWHTWDFQDSLCTWPNLSDHSVAAVDARGRIQGLLPLHVTNERFGPLPLTRVDSFGGPAVAVPLNGRTDGLRNRVAQALWAHAEALAKRLTALELTASLAPITPAWRGANAPAVNPLLFLGLECVPAQTWMIDLSVGPDALWKRLEGRARTAVRKALNGGFTVREASGPADATTYARLHVDTFRRTGATPHPDAYSRCLFDVHQPRGEALILFAQNDTGSPLAAANFAICKAGAFYWTAAADEEARRAGAPSLLLWHGIRLLQERGIHWLDVGNAFPQARHGKLKGLSDFKASFGGYLVPHWRGRFERPARHLRALQGAWQIVKALRP